MSFAGFGTSPFGSAPFGGTSISRITYPGLLTFPGADTWPGYSDDGPGPIIIDNVDAYTATLRSSHTMWHTVTAQRNGVSVWPHELQIVSGSVTDDASAAVRRTLALTVVPERGLFDALAPIGTELAVASVLRYPSGTTQTIRHGTFVIDVQRLGYATDGNLSITAPDRWIRVQRARFIYPQASVPGAKVTDQITGLVRGALGFDTPVINLSTSTTTVGSLIWETDRDKAIGDLATAASVSVSFDRDGICTIADLPTLGRAAVWSVNAGAKGILLSADRERSRQRTYNVVKVSSDKTDGTAPFDPQVAWDSDPFSPTYAGPDPRTNPTAAGPLGVVPYFFTSPILDSAEGALRAAFTILYRVTGVAAQLTLSAVKNPALDSLQVIDVLLPAEGGGGSGGQVERHIVDRVTHPLTPADAQEIATRSTRADEYT